jgi:toxin HigB-1
MSLNPLAVANGSNGSIVSLRSIINVALARGQSRVRSRRPRATRDLHTTASKDPGWRFHALKGDLAGHWAVSVDENWRLTFMFEGDDAVLVDYRDYH